MMQSILQQVQSSFSQVIIVPCCGCTLQQGVYLPIPLPMTVHNTVQKTGIRLSRRTGRVTTPARLLEATRLMNACNRGRLGLGLGGKARDG